MILPTLMWSGIGMKLVFDLILVCGDIRVNRQVTLNLLSCSHLTRFELTHSHF